jgi:hypothetical protein
MLRLEAVMDMLREIHKRRTMRSLRRRNGINESSLMGVDKEQYWQE